MRDEDDEPWEPPTTGWPHQRPVSSVLLAGVLLLFGFVVVVVIIIISQVILKW